MPLIVHQPSGHTTIASNSSGGPDSNIKWAMLTLLLNPPFGLFALIFSILSKHAASMDWDGAMLKGKISLGFSVTGIITAAIVGVALILIFFSRDSST